MIENYGSKTDLWSYPPLANYQNCDPFKFCTWENEAILRHICEGGSPVHNQEAGMALLPVRPILPSEEGGGQEKDHSPWR